MVFQDATQQLEAAEKIALPDAARHVVRVALEPFAADIA